MTSLEIKRIDSIKTRSTSSGLNSSNSNNTTKEIISSGVVNRYSLPQNNNSLSSPSSKSTHQNNVDHLPDVVPITIVKSPSYNNQLTALSKGDESEKGRQKSPSRNSQLDHSVGSAGGDQVVIDTDTLKFNKYGFAQANKVNEQILNAENKSNGNANHNNHTENNDLDESRSSSSKTEKVVVTNLKDYIQNTDVEEFSEKLPIKVIQERELKWVDMLANFDEWMSKRFKKIKSRCRKGIPQSMRAKAWMHLTGAVLLKQQKPNYYAECLANPRHVEIGKYVEDIKKDLHRQFPSHEMFMKREGREMLQNVLMAYAVHNREVGYCQAQGPIAALLLMHMPEEDAFWMLIRISDYYLTEYYKPGLEKVQIDGRALFHLFKRENPAAAKLMQQQSIDPILYMTEWYMCIYARTLPWCTVLRIWDMFFCEGVKVLYRVGLYLMNVAFSHDKHKFARAQQQGMYETLSLLKNLPVHALKESVLVRDSCLIKVGEAELKKAFEKAKVEFVKQTAELQAQRKQPPPKSSYMNTNNQQKKEKK